MLQPDRIRDRDLGAELGYRRPWAIRQTINARLQELRELGPLEAVREPCRGPRKHEMVYYLTLEQAERLKAYTMVDKKREHWADPARQRARIEADSIPEPNSGCWLWLGGRNNRGYGLFAINKRKALVHRTSYEVFVGPVPRELDVLHRCDNPGCCNPGHLFLGTAKDNTADMARKGRGWWQRKGAA